MYSKMDINTYDSNTQKWEYTAAVYNTMLQQQPIYKLIYNTEQPTKEGLEMQGLYEVWLVYAEDRKAPVVSSKLGIIADSDEDAKLKSGLLSTINKDWDMDYLTILTQKIGDVKVKAKPKEVKQTK